MGETGWFYVRNNERIGPVGLAELRQLLLRGEVQPQTLVWTAGMSQWTPAGQVATLSHNVSASTVPSTSPAPARAPVPTAALHQPTSTPSPAVAYYGAAAGIPPRAAQNLQGHALPSGDTGDWPLDDARVAHFQQAVKLRKKVTGAANLYRLLLFISAIGLGVTAVVGGLVLLTGPGGAVTPGALGSFVVLAMSAGFTALYYFTWRATMRAHRWAPLTMFILFLVMALFYLLLLLVPTSNPRTDIYGNVGAIILATLFAIFAVVSWNSFAAIPKYLAQPAWCQELIVQAGL